MSRYKKITTICCAAVIALGLAACGGGGDGITTEQQAQIDAAKAAEAAQAAQDKAVADAKAAIAAAETEEAAQAAIDTAVAVGITAAQLRELETARDERVMELAVLGRAGAQRMALMDASGMIDTSEEALSTQEGVDAARTAIAALRQAIADAVDVDDKSMYETQLNNAVAAVDEAQGGIDTATRRTNQMTALSDASTTLQAALAALSGSTPTQAQLDAANNALVALNTAIEGGADLTDDEKAPYQREADNAAAPIQTAEKAKEDADDEAEKTANAAMAVTARKLYAGIAAPTGDVTNPALTDRAAAYNTSHDAILVSAGGPAGATAAAVTLSEDKKTTVAANHGWAGKRFADPKGGTEYEAMVWSNVEAPKMGRKFGHMDPGTGTTRDFEYDLDANGYLTAAEADGVGANNDAFVASRIAFTGVTRTAGMETFKKTADDVFVKVPGSYHGVAGTYRCTPASGNTCSATAAEKGFTFESGETWTFEPTNANARVTSGIDTMYSSYGWWIRTATDGKVTVSAFHDHKDGATTPTTVNLPEAGTATYVGGAAGKYALTSTTGGINDAGHFTARATLEAEFGTGDANTISGTIDQFVGADGESRDWTVKLNETDSTDGGLIDGLGGAGGTAVGTVWTIGDDAADKSGSWSGNLREQGTDGVPQVATGTFDSTYGTAGKMVGAFGANEQ